MQYELDYQGMPSVVKRINFFATLSQWTPQIGIQKLLLRVYNSLPTNLKSSDSFIEELCKKKVLGSFKKTSPRQTNENDLTIVHFRTSNWREQTKAVWETFIILLKCSKEIEKINFVSESLLLTTLPNQRFWKRISIFVSQTYQIKFSLQTTGVEILKFNTETCKIFSWFNSAIKLKHKINNPSIREHFSSNIYQQNSNHVQGNQEDLSNFEKLVDCLLYFNVPTQEICHFCDLLAACLLLGGGSDENQQIFDDEYELNSTGSLDNLDIFNLIIQSNITLEQFQDIECHECKAQVKLYNNDNVKSSLLFIYQIICDWISKVIASYNNFEGQESQLIHLTFSGDLLQNQSKYDLNFADFLTNLTHQLLSSNLELADFYSILHENSYLTPNLLIKKLQQQNLVSGICKFQNEQIQMNSLFGNTTYDLGTTIPLNHFSLKPTVQEVLLKSNNIILRQYVKQNPTTAMHMIWNKINKFKEKPPQRERIYEEIRLPQINQQLNLVTCTDSECHFQTISRVNSVNSLSFEEQDQGKLIQTISSQQSYQQGMGFPNFQEQEENQEISQTGQELVQQLPPFKEGPSSFSEQNQPNQQFIDYNSYSESSNEIPTLLKYDSNENLLNEDKQQIPQNITQSTKIFIPKQQLKPHYDPYNLNDYCEEVLFYALHEEQFKEEL